MTSMISFIKGKMSPDPPSECHLRRCIQPHRLATYAEYAPIKREDFLWAGQILFDRVRGDVLYYDLFIYVHSIYMICDNYSMEMHR